MTSLVKVETQRFFDKDIHVLKYNDNDYFVAKEVAEALEYSDFKNLSNKIHQDWKDEFVENVDFIYLEGKELNKFIANFADGDRHPQTILSPKARSLMLLAEEGVQIACLKSQTKKAIEFRRWVATLLSDMRRGVQPQVTSIQKNDKEEHYKNQRDKIRLREAKQAQDLVKLSRDIGVDQKAQQVLLAYAAEVTFGKKILELLPAQDTEKFYSPTEMAQILSISPQKVGKILKELKLHGEMTKDNNKALLSKAKGKDNPKAVPVFVYNGFVLDALTNYLKPKQMGLLEITSGSDSQDGLDF